MAKKIIKIIAGIFITSTAICGYYRAASLMYELTFISNMAGGIILLSDGLIGLILRKNAPALLYQMVLPCLTAVFSTCVFALLGLFDFNFADAFFFLHVINPPVFLLVYLFCTDIKTESRSDYFIYIFLSPFMIMCYLLFDYIRFLITGGFVYGLIPTEIITPISAILIGLGFYFLMAFLSFGFMKLKLYAQKKINH